MAASRYFRRLRPVALAGPTVALPALAQAQSAQDTPGPSHHRAPANHVLYIESNDPSPDKNAVLAHTIANDGSLKLGSFDNDQQLVLDPHHDLLWTVNGGSDTVSAMRLDKDGKPSLLRTAPFLSQGSTPISIGLHNGTLLALNSAEDPSQAGTGQAPKISVFRPEPDNSASYAPYAGYSLPAGGMLRAFYQVPYLGFLVPADAVKLPVENGTQALPLGLWANPRALFVCRLRQHQPARGP